MGCQKASELRRRSLYSSRRLFLNRHGLPVDCRTVERRKAAVETVFLIQGRKSTRSSEAPGATPHMREYYLNVLDLDPFNCEA